MGSILAETWRYSQDSATFLKGQLIVLPHTNHDYIYAIQEGAVKLFDITPEGTENTIAILGPDDIFPVDQLFSHIRREGVHYQAFTNCTLWRTPHRAFNKQLSSDSAMFRVLIDYFVERELDYQLRIKGLEQLRADFKLAYILAFLVRKFGRLSHGRAAFEMDVPFTQQDFANLVGLTRETTCIQMKKLEKLGVVRHKHRRYVVYHKKLHDFVAEELVPVQTL